MIVSSKKEMNLTQIILNHLRHLKGGVINSELKVIFIHIRTYIVHTIIPRE